MLNDVFSRIREVASAYWLVLSIIVVAAVVVAVVAVLICLHVVESGFDGKTAWDWLEMLVVPLAGVLLAGLFAVYKVKADRRAEEARKLAEETRKLAEERAEEARELAEERTQVETLSTYLDRIQELATAHDLQSSNGIPARAVARARTLAALRVLNGTRKGILLRFLHEAGLTKGDRPVLDLALADLTNVDLVGADLGGINLERANLSFGDLNGAVLKGSHLKGCLLNDADLGHVDMKGATVDDTQLANCRDLVGATLPDGEQVDEGKWVRMRSSS